MNTVNRAVLCLLLGGAVCFYSCSKGNSSATTPPPTPPPAISSISPDSGVLGTTVTISGSGFSANTAENLVKFNDSTAVVSSASTTQLTVKVPKSAGTGPVTVTVGGKTATGPVFNYTYSVTVSTVAGSGNIAGFADGNAATAQFGNLTGICIDNQGNLYVADASNSKIRKITPSGVVSTVAGTTWGFADGNAATAQFYFPTDICADSQGNLYVTDAGNYRIRKITPSGIVSTVAGSGTLGFADGNAATAQFGGDLTGICVDNLGNIYVSDLWNYKIRKITPSGIVSTVAGSGTQGFADGNAATAQFFSPNGIFIDRQGNLYVADSHNDKIRKITPSGIVSTVAGTSHGDADGNAATAQFRWPEGVCVDSQGNTYIVDTWNNKIKRMTPSGVISTFAGISGGGYTDGNAATAQFLAPSRICIDGQGSLYVTDPGNYRIRKIVIQ